MKITMIGLLCICALAAVDVHAEEGVEVPLGDPYDEYYKPRDEKGLWRDSLYFVGYQVATVGILFVMPEGVSGWTEESKEEYSFSKWWENVTDPEWDTDDDYINYILHPYWGAAYYVRARDRGYGKDEAFVYSALMSTLFEFGVEALFENVSIQDLISTPLGGLIVGEYFYRVHSRIRLRHAEGAVPTFRDRVALALTDPLGSINRQVDKWLGRDAELSMRTFVTSPGGMSQHFTDTEESFFFDAAPRDKVMGVHFELRF